MQYDIIEYQYHCYARRHLLMSRLQVEWPMKLQIARGVTRGMNYLHTKDPEVVHGDLKVENVLIGDGYTAKVKIHIHFLMTYYTKNLSLSDGTLV